MRGLNSLIKGKEYPLQLQPATKSGETYQVLTGVGSLGAAAVLSVGAGHAVRQFLPGWDHSLYNRNIYERGAAQAIAESDEAQVLGPIDQFISEGYDELEDEVPKKAQINDEDY